MYSLNASEARKSLYRLLDQVAQEHEPVIITGARNSGVLVSQARPSGRS